MSSGASSYINIDAVTVPSIEINLFYLSFSFLNSWFKLLSILNSPCSYKLRPAKYEGNHEGYLGLLELFIQLLAFFELLGVLCSFGSTRNSRIL